jgi:hypothetical protein
MAVLNSIVDQDEFWTYYTLRMDIKSLCGGLPTDPAMILAWQQKNWKESAKVGPDDPQTPEEAAERTLGYLEGVEPEKGWTTFPRRDGIFCVETRQIKAMLKEAANIMKGLLPVKDKVIPLRSKLAERVFVSRTDPLIPITPERTKPDRTIERAIHVMTAQGPRDALKRTDVLDEAHIECTLKVLNDGVFDDKMLVRLLNYAAENGFGADRSQGFGTFYYELQR